MFQQPGLRYLWRVLAFSLLFFSAALFPCQRPFGHDLECQAAYDYWACHEYQFGVDMVVNVGPLGFINYPATYSGFGTAKKVLCHFALIGLMVVLLMRAAASIAWWPARCAVIPIFAFFSGVPSWGAYTSADVHMYLLMLLIADTLLNGRSRGAKIALTGVLGLLALSKGTMMYISTVIILGAVASLCLKRNFLFALSVVGSFTAHLAAGWLLCGQRLENLPEFVGASVRFAQGYNEGMALREPVMVTLAGVTVFLLVAVVIFLRHGAGWRNLTPAEKLGVSIWIGVELFLLLCVWKHGFVRADKHVLTFFQFSLSAVLIWGFSNKRHPDAPASAPPPFLSAVTALVLAGCFVGGGRQMLETPRLLENARFVLRFPEYRARLEAGLRRTVKEQELPQIRAAVGDARVANFGYMLGAMVYNDFNYRPLRSPISYAAWNPWIMRRDAELLRDPRKAPDFIVATFQSFDGRLAAQDDSLAQLEMLRRYLPVLVEGDKLLLQRRKDQPEPLVPTIRAKQELEFGKWVDVPVFAGHGTIAAFRLEHDRFAHLVAALYKPTGYQLEYENDEGSRHLARFNPLMAETGFLMRPLIQDNAGFLTAQRLGAAASGIRKFRIVASHQTLTMAVKMHLEFSSLDVGP